MYNGNPDGLILALAATDIKALVVSLFVLPSFARLIRCLDSSAGNRTSPPEFRFKPFGAIVLYAKINFVSYSLANRLLITNKTSVLKFSPPCLRMLL